eukprot:ANDGO_03591.mRNA.1 hypothetical protein
MGSLAGTPVHMNVESLASEADRLYATIVSLDAATQHLRHHHPLLHPLSTHAANTHSQSHSQPQSQSQLQSHPITSPLSTPHVSTEDAHAFAHLKWTKPRLRDGVMVHKAVVPQIHPDLQLVRGQLMLDARSASVARIARAFEDASSRAAWDDMCASCSTIVEHLSSSSFSSSSSSVSSSSQLSQLSSCSSLQMSSSPSSADSADSADSSLLCGSEDTLASCTLDPWHLALEVLHTRRVVVVSGREMVYARAAKIIPSTSNSNTNANNADLTANTSTGSSCTTNALSSSYGNSPSWVNVSWSIEPCEALLASFASASGKTVNAAIGGGKKDVVRGRIYVSGILVREVPAVASVEVLWFGCTHPLGNLSIALVNKTAAKGTGFLAGLGVHLDPGFKDRRKKWKLPKITSHTADDDDDDDQD